MSYIINPYRHGSVVEAGDDDEISFDTTTKGDWVGVYGDLGYYIPVFGSTTTERSSFSSEITNTSRTGGFKYWQASYDTDANALKDPLNTAQRKGGLIGLWTSGVDFTSVFEWTSTIALKVSVFVMKHSTTRSMRVSLRDGSGTILGSTRTINQATIANNAWVVYSVKSGTRRIMFDQRSGDNPNWTAIFFSTL